MNGYEGMCMSGGKFLKSFLRVTLTQKIITRRVLKIHEWIQGDVYK